MLTVSGGAEDAIVLHAEEGRALSSEEARAALRELGRDPVLSAIRQVLDGYGEPSRAGETLDLSVGEAWEPSSRRGEAGRSGRSLS